MAESLLITDIELYELLKAKLGEKEAKSLVEYVETRIDRKLDDKKDVLATKIDLANLKADIIKWMFLFWIGQLASLIALFQIFSKQ